MTPSLIICLTQKDEAALSFTLSSLLVLNCLCTLANSRILGVSKIFIMQNILSLVSCFFFLVSCNAQTQTGPEDLMHLKYGSGKQNTLDLYLPKTYTEKTPVIIMLHGGAWVMGGNEYTDKTSKDLRDRGFVVANVDYRYVNDSVSAKNLLRDIDDAITYVEKQSAQYHYSPKGYHMAGISAGAHLSLLYGYTTSKTIKSITALCAPSRLDNPNDINEFNKHQLVHNVELLADAKYIPGQKLGTEFTVVSPYSHIKAIPTLLFHGDADDLVPYSQSVFLYEQLQKKGVKSKFVTMKGKGHDCGMNQPDSEKKVLDEITKWVELYN